MLVVTVRGVWLTTNHCHVIIASPPIGQVARDRGHPIADVCQPVVALKSTRVYLWLVRGVLASTGLILLLQLN